MKIIDIILGLVILALIATLIYAVSTKVPEPFTELYFENHTLLPKYSSQNSFIFSIHNHENKPVLYDVQVRLDYNSTNATIQDFQITVPDDVKKTFRVNYTLPPDFGTGRIIVELNGTGESIHYWTTYAARTTTYNGKLVSLDCVPTIPWGESVLLKVRGTNDTRVIIRNNEKLLYNRTINGTRYINLTPEAGMLDIQFSNDYYNATTGVDRNLNLDYLKAGDLFYDKLAVDRGSGAASFDCANAALGNKLSGNGAFRVFLDKPQKSFIILT